LFFNRNIQPQLEKWTRTKNQNIKEFLGEIFGTFLLVCFGCASVAQFKFSNQTDNVERSLLPVNLGFGFGAVVAILVTGKISGKYFIKENARAHISLSGFINEYDPFRMSY
jgi:hypothetical protein